MIFIFVRISKTRITNNFKIRYHELANKIPADDTKGANIITPKNGIWKIFENEKYRVIAASLKHSVPCWGWVIEELPRPSISFLFYFFIILNF
jgi:ribonuclease BN (tRNA processing enzyme)